MSSNKETKTGKSTTENAAEPHISEVEISSQSPLGSLTEVDSIRDEEGQKSSAEIRILGVDDKTQKLFLNKSKSKWYEKLSLQNIVQAVRRQFRIWTTFPMVSSASIYFDEDDRYGTTGEPVKTAECLGDKLIPESVEVEANYEKATQELFEIMIKYRKEAKAAKDNYHTMKVDISKFPEWTDIMIDRLRITFQVFDVSGDGLVDFEELSAVLAEFGDTSEEAVRRKYFDQVDDGCGSIDFMEFITMIYKLTVKTPKDAGASELANSYRAIDRNMARIRSLDVVQQLQAGLF